MGYFDEQRKAPSILRLLVTASFWLLVIIYIGVSMNTKDPIWFWPVFDGQAYEIVMNCYGEYSIFRPSTPQHQQLTMLLNEQLSSWKNWDQLTMSDETYEYYQTSDDVVVLEYHYSPQVRIHSAYAFYKNVNSLVIPLDGRHSNQFAVFGRVILKKSPSEVIEYSSTGSFLIGDNEPLIDYLQTQGLCDFKP
jgi:hypothetical protein